MASVNWKKATRQYAGAIKKHLGQKERQDSNHSNKHINKDLTPNNYAIGCKDYQEAYQAMLKRTKEVDEEKPPKRIRKDRVVCCFLELPCPRSITEQGRSKDFFEQAHKIYEDFFGKDNVHGSFIHVDEVHEYTDKNGDKQMSCEHAHTLVSAFTVDKGINGKAFETIARIKALNKAMDNMCMRVFGISLNTGETPQRKSAETLKMESEAREDLGKYKEAAAKSRDEWLENDDKAKKAESRWTEAEQRADGAEKRADFAEERTRKANAKYDVATKELETVLNKKARASEIRRNPFDRETQSYHINMLESTRAIGHEAFEYMQQGKKDKQEAVVMKQETEQRSKAIEKKEQSIEPLYQKAKEDREQAQKLRENIEKEIETRADELSEKKIQEMFGGVSTKRERRLEEFCEEIQLSNGLNVLEAFEEQERQLKKRSRGYER